MSNILDLARNLIETMDRCADALRRDLNERARPHRLHESGSRARPRWGGELQMKDVKKNKAQLIEELTELRKAVFDPENTEGNLQGSFGVITDITHRKQAQERVEHLNRVLRAIREVNQLIVSEKDRDALIERACEILPETRGYRHAWIALTDKARTAILVEEDRYARRKTTPDAHNCATPGS
jgi:hypothetical protein